MAEKPYINKTQINQLEMQQQQQKRRRKQTAQMPKTKKNKNGFKPDSGI